jgi:hypothetical protein
MGQDWVIADLDLMRGTEYCAELGEILLEDCSDIISLLFRQVNFPEPPNLGPSALVKGSILLAEKSLTRCAIY